MNDLAMNGRLTVDEISFCLSSCERWIPGAGLKYSAVIVPAAATFAAIREGHFIRTGRE